MIINKKKSQIIIFNAIIAAIAVFGFLCTTVSAEQPRLNDQKNKIENQREKAKSQIHKLKLLEKIETNKLYKNQQKLEYNQHNLERSQIKYNNIKDEVANLQKKLDVLLVEHNRHLMYARKRIVQMYKHKRNNYIEFLLNSEDINAFLDRLYFENIIIAYDKKRLEETKIHAREILALKSRIELQKRNLEASIKDINKQQDNIQDAIKRNERLIEKLKTDRATWEKSERELASQSRKISQMINNEIRKTERQGVNVVVSGSFARPVAGRITSPFGYRVHPIFKRRIFHSGVDIGAPYGTPIKAANSGRVMFVGWYNGYGKVVIINHGNINGIPTTTLYAHMSVTVAKQGTNVTKGEVIGKVGTTGYSTGPHLHFEVRQKGNPVNPLNFVK